MVVFMGMLSTLAALAAITTSEGATSQAERYLRKPAQSRHNHHAHFYQHHGANTLHDARAPHHAKAHMSPAETFGGIQKTLVGAWKEKAHLESIQRTLTSQKELFDVQKKVLLANNDVVDEEERKQFLQMYQMVKESRTLADKVRNSAVKKAQDAISAVMNIDTDTDQMILQNKKDIAELQLRIAEDIAANSEANRTKQRAKTVLAAAVQEAKYFQKVLDKAKMEKEEARYEEQSVADVASELKERKASSEAQQMMDVATEMKERKTNEEQDEEAGAQKDEQDKQQAVEERDKDREGGNQDKQPLDDKASQDDREVLATLKHIITEAN